MLVYGGLGVERDRVRERERQRGGIRIHLSLAHRRGSSRNKRHGDASGAREVISPKRSVARGVGVA